jgi:hypothetical protein
MRDNDQCAHGRRQFIVRVVARAHVFGEVFRLHELANVMEIRRGSVEVGAYGCRRLGEFATARRDEVPTLRA